MGKRKLRRKRKKIRTRTRNFMKKNKKKIIRTNIKKI